MGRGEAWIQGEEKSERGTKAVEHWAYYGATLSLERALIGCLVGGRWAPLATPPS